VIGLFAHLRV